jgi:hypothetical protein
MVVRAMEASDFLGTVGKGQPVHLVVPAGGDAFHLVAVLCSTKQ